MGIDPRSSGWLDSNSAVHPDSPRGGGGPGRFRAPGPTGVDPLRAGSRANGWADVRISNATRPRPVADVTAAQFWPQLRAAAQAALGPYSFGLDFCVGIVQNPIGAAADLVD